jgi:hypothetical protein
MRPFFMPVLRPSIEARTRLLKYYLIHATFDPHFHTRTATADSSDTAAIRAWQHCFASISGFNHVLPFGLRRAFRKILAINNTHPTDSNIDIANASKSSISEARPGSAPRSTL